MKSATIQGHLCSSDSPPPMIKEATLSGPWLDRSYFHKPKILGWRQNYLAPGHPRCHRWSHSVPSCFGLPLCAPPFWWIWPDRSLRQDIFVFIPICAHSGTCPKLMSMLTLTMLMSRFILESKSFLWLATRCLLLYFLMSLPCAGRHLSKDFEVQEQNIWVQVVNIPFFWA